MLIQDYHYIFVHSRCYTCGRNISHVWVKYKKTIKSLTSNDYTNLPLRTINNKQLLSNDPKTKEGTILDKNGLLLYCCRRMILQLPINKFLFILIITFICSIGISNSIFSNR